MAVKYELNKNWTFSLSGNSNPPADKKLIPGQQYPAVVPGTIHTDLLNNNLIEDPFYSDNELHLQWISDCDWVYQTKFDFNGDIERNTDLVFEGLDTISTIYLNDIKIGSTDNMFLTYKFNVKNILMLSNNLLKVIIRSPVNYSAQQEKKYGRLPVALNSGRVYIRKAQYSFGWDWGPSFPTSGIWRKVYLVDSGETAIENVTFNTKKICNSYADAEVGAFVNTSGSKNITMAVSLSNDKDSYLQKVPVQSSGKYIFSFRINDPLLWWPNGEGDQNLYFLKIQITDADDSVLDEVQRKVGIRTIKLILNENHKPTFKFRINDRDIFCKGVNWIPADSFLPRVTRKKYSDLLSLAKQANINIVRVWGGGIYENNEFYELCDQLGFLVWQDFLFACASYPEFEGFINNIQEEITQNVLRLQHHPCLSVWCGNNENEWIWSQGHLSSFKKMPGYKIYHKIIPGILKTIDPDRPYWPSSPFGNDANPNSYKSGNTHQWKIWSNWVDYSYVKNDKSLFVTEFGFQGPANKDTFEGCLPPGNRNINDRIFRFHNKQIEGPERVLKFLSGHLPVRTEWNDYLYLAQLNQAFALKHCLEYWRTNGRTNGSIIWQLNDCWPVTSWSIIDSDIKPKLAYYFVKNTFDPCLVYFKDEGSKIKIILLNQNKETINGNMKLTVINSVSGEVWKVLTSPLMIVKKENTVVSSVSRENLPRNEAWILDAASYDESDKLICRNYYSTEPWKYKKLKKTVLKINIKGNELILKSDNPVFFIDLYHPGFTFSDRGFTIMPGDKVILTFSGNQNKSLKVKDIKVFSLNDYLSN